MPHAAGANNFQVNTHTRPPTKFFSLRFLMHMASLTSIFTLSSCILDWWLGLSHKPAQSANPTTEEPGQKFLLQHPSAASQAYAWVLPKPAQRTCMATSLRADGDLVSSSPSMNSSQTSYSATLQPSDSSTREGIQQVNPNRHPSHEH